MSVIRPSTSLGLLTLLGVLNLASSAVAFPIKLPSWLTPKPSAVTSQLPPPPPTTTSPAPTSTPDAATSTTAGQSGFQCQLINGQYTVMYLPQSQPSLSYPWAIPQAMGGGWTPDKRCAEISRRLETYRPDGMIELQTGQENGYNTVCVTTQKASGCRIVFTVPNGQDPASTRDRVFQNIAFAEKGQQTQGVNTLVAQGNGNNSLDRLIKMGQSILGSGLGSSQPTLTARSDKGGIDLRPFLDPADGGTGARLTSGMTQYKR